MLQLRSGRATGTALDPAGRCDTAGSGWQPQCPTQHRVTFPRRQQQSPPHTTTSSWGSVACPTPAGSSLPPSLPTEALSKGIHPQGNCWAGKLSHSRSACQWERQAWVIMPRLEQPLADVNFLISQLGYLWRKTQASAPLTTLHVEQQGLLILESIGTSPRKYSNESCNSSVGHCQSKQVPRAQGVCGLINYSVAISTSGAPHQGDEDYQHPV